MTGAVNYRNIFWPEVTEQWEDVELGDVVSQHKTTVEEIVDESVVVCSVTNNRGFVLSDDYFEKKVYSDNIDNYKIVDNDVFAYNPSRIDVGSIAHQDQFQKAAISPMYEVFSVDSDKILPKYMNILVNTPKMITLFEAFSQGSVRETLNFSQFKEIPISLPPIQIQNEIIDRVNKISRSINETEILENKYSDIYKGISNRLFPNLEKSKQSIKSKPTIGTDWNVQPLRKIGSMSRGKFTHRPRNDPTMYDGDYPFVQTGEVASAQGELTNYTQTLSEDGKKVSKRFEPGTVLITIAGNVGDTAVATFPVYFPDSVIGLMVNEDINEYYIEHALRHYSRELSETSTESTQKNLNLKILRSFNIPVPSLETQQKIAERLSKVDEISKTERNNHEELSRIRNEVSNILVSQEVQTND